MCACYVQHCPRYSDVVENGPRRCCQVSNLLSFNVAHFEFMPSVKCVMLTVRRWCRWHHGGELWRLLPNPNVLVAFSVSILLVDDALKPATPLIAPLVSGVAGLSASYSSKADTLNIWCKSCWMWQLLYTITETINMLFAVLNFLKCVVTEIVLFSVVAFKTHDISQDSVVTHLRCGKIFSDSIITNFLLILVMK